MVLVPSTPGYSEANYPLVTGHGDVGGEQWDDFYIRIGLETASRPR